MTGNPDRLELGHIRALADEIMEKVVAMVDASGEEPSGVYFLMWTELTRALAMGGWTADELAKDARWHALDQKKQGAGI